MSNRVVSSCVHPEEGEAELHGCLFVLYRGAGANKVIENISRWLNLFTDDGGCCYSKVWYLFCV